MIAMNYYIYFKTTEGGRAKMSNVVEEYAKSMQKKKVQRLL